MEKRILMLAVITAVGVFGSASIAGGPLGPPRAFVGHGKWLVDIEYAHEDMDLKSTGRAHSYLYDGTPLDSASTKFHIEDIESDVIFGSLAYGLWESWDVYVRLGAANAKDDLEEHGLFAAPGESYNFDGSHGFAWGVGTRATFCQCGRWTFGAVGQVTWVNPGDDDVSWAGDTGEGSTSTISGDADLNWRQFQVGIGATYQADGWWVYGGPCLFFVNGDLKATLTETVDGSEYHYKYRHDLREEAEFGGWLGVGCNLPQNARCYAEAQIYGDGWLIGGGVLFPLAVP
jgi:hypothetical protein